MFISPKDFIPPYCRGTLRTRPRKRPQKLSRDSRRDHHETVSDCTGAFACVDVEVAFPAEDGNVSVSDHVLCISIIRF